MRIKLITLFILFTTIFSTNIFSQVWAYEGELWAIPIYVCPGEEMELTAPSSGILYYSIHSQGDTPSWTNITNISLMNQAHSWIVPDDEGDILEFKLVSWGFNVAPIYSEPIIIECLINIGDGIKNTTVDDTNTDTDTPVLLDMDLDFFKTDNDLIQLQKADLQIGPNPFQNDLNITWNMNQEAEVSIYLYDLTGKRVDVIRDSMWTQEGSQQLTYNASHLQTGAYVIEVLYNEQRQTFKLIKPH